MRVDHEAARRKYPPNRQAGETSVIIAWNGHRPVYATKRLLEWRSKARQLGEEWERLMDTPGPDFDAARQAYYDHLCS